MNRFVVVFYGSCWCVRLALAFRVTNGHGAFVGLLAASLQSRRSRFIQPRRTSLMWDNRPIGVNSRGPWGLRELVDAARYSVRGSQMTERFCG